MASANNNKNLYCPNKPSSSPYVLKVSFSESNINAVNNTTIINATASLSSSSGANWSSSYNSSLSIYWWDEDTRKETYITSINFSSIALSSTKTVSGSITVQHNSNGKKEVQLEFILHKDHPLVVGVQLVQFFGHQPLTLQLFQEEVSLAQLLAMKLEVILHLT